MFDFGFCFFFCKLVFSNSVTLKAILTMLVLPLLYRWDVANNGKIASTEFTSDMQCLSCAYFDGDVCIKA